MNKPVLMIDNEEEFISSPPGYQRIPQCFQEDNKDLYYLLEPDNPFLDPFEAYVRHQACDILYEAIEKLNFLPRRKFILYVLYELKYYKRQTLEECAKKFGVTRERIRQSHGNSLFRLKEYLIRKYTSLDNIL